MLKLKNIKSGYGKKIVLNNVSAIFRDNCITVILGANGAGKSTVLKTAFGIIKPIDGQIFLYNEDIKPEPQILVKRGICFIPQKNRVFSEMSVLENLELVTHSWTNRSLFQQYLKDVLELFPDLKLNLCEKAGKLSGGQQQMVALARGLISKPKMVLMDEPSIGLSPKLINEFFYKIRNLQRNTKTAFVIVEHNLKTLLPLTDYVYVLQNGQIVYDGKSNETAVKKLVSVMFE